jgi:hypothetical protein
MPVSFFDPVPTGKHGSSTLTDHPHSSGVIQDAKFKRRDALADLGKAAAKL